MRSRKVLKNNIDPYLVDVKRPEFNYREATGSFILDLRLKSFINNRRKFSIFKNGLIIVGAIVLAMSIVSFHRVTSLRATAEIEGQNILSNLISSAGSIKDFHPDDAKQTLVENQKKLEEFQQELESGPNKLTLSMLGQFVPSVKSAGSFMKKFASLQGDLILFLDRVENLKMNGFYNFQNNGQMFRGDIETLRSVTKDIASKTSELRNLTSTLKNFPQFDSLDKFLNDYYLGYSKDLRVLDGFWDGLIDFLSGSEEKRLLLMFQNSSEIRPAGGFLGSYGEIILKEGQMRELRVGDIYWPDHKINFDLKLVPPEPLQRVTKDWGARDANWFFDFPTSAEAVMTLLESSKIYKDEGVKFEGAIGVDVDILGSILEVIGPVYIEKYDIEVNGDNFLSELQREVETGQDKQAGENPKKILAVLAPEIMSRLNNLSDTESKKIFEIIDEYVSKKDVVFYSRDSRIANFLNMLNVGGSLYDLSSDFWGSYFAVVNANVAGGKTDAFMEQKIDLRVDVGTDGSVVGDATITRRHLGGDEKDSWYNADNKNYMKIFVNPGSDLILVNGNTPRTRAYRDYAGYDEYPPLKKISDSQVFIDRYNTWKTKEFGKDVFGTWMITEPGEENPLNVRYKTPLKDKRFVSEGDKFRFIFDKQSGVSSELKVTLSSPLGFVWAESNSSTYIYEKKETLKREKISLTLIRS